MPKNELFFFARRYSKSQMSADERQIRADERISVGHGEKKTRRLDQFIAAMLKPGTVEAAATVAGIAASTAHRWLKDPEVIRRLAAERRDAMNRAMTRLQEAATGAVDCL